MDSMNSDFHHGSLIAFTKCHAIYDVFNISRGLHQQD